MSLKVLEECMPTATLKDFADRCRKMANSETDPRLRSKFLQMADDYQHRAEGGRIQPR
jgi:hypothetical protein